MEWKEVDPKQDDWVKQIDVMAYYGDLLIGSIIYTDEDYWQYDIDGYLDDLDAKSQEEAKEEMIEKLEEYFGSQIDYFEALTNMLNDLRGGTP